MEYKYVLHTNFGAVMLPFEVLIEIGGKFFYCDQQFEVFEWIKDEVFSKRPDDFIVHCRCLGGEGFLSEIRENNLKNILL